VLLMLAQISCHAVLFYLDGVLVDSTSSVGRVWGWWARQHRLDPDAVIRTAHGRRSIETIRHWTPHLDALAENRVVEQMEIDDSRGLQVIAGASALLAALPDGRWAVVTSGTRALAQSRIRAAALPTPAVLVSADDVLRGKPDPEPWLKAAKLLGVAAAECVVLEDTPAGIDSARAAGMRVIALTTTYPTPVLQAAEFVVATLKDIQIASSGTEIRLTARIFTLPEADITR
jgi:sugar-phosphatase